jgi:hypothetical protein
MPKIIHRKKKPSIHGSTRQSASLREFSQIRKLVFKCEAYNDAGIATGPLYAELVGIGTVRSVRYMTISEAKELAGRCGTELIDS